MTNQTILELVHQRKNSIFIIIFLLLCVLIILFPQNIIDNWVSVTIQRSSPEWLVQTFGVLNLINRPYIFIPLCLFTSVAYYLKGYGNNAFGILLSFGVHIPVYILKTLISRPRPFSGNVSTFETASGASFPSGTVAFATVFFGFIALISPMKIPILKAYWSMVMAGLCIIGISCSRIYFGVHWFTDTLGGVMIGIIFLLWLKKFS